MNTLDLKALIVYNVYDSAMQENHNWTIKLGSPELDEIGNRETMQQLEANMESGGKSSRKSSERSKDWILSMIDFIDKHE